MAPNFSKLASKFWKLVSKQKDALTSRKYALTSRKYFKRILLRDFQTIFGFMAHPPHRGLNDTNLRVLKPNSVDRSFCGRRNFAYSKDSLFTVSAESFAWLGRLAVTCAILLRILRKSILPWEPNMQFCWAMLKALKITCFRNELDQWQISKIVCNISEMNSPHQFWGIVYTVYTPSGS